MNRRELLVAPMAATLRVPAGAGPCAEGAANTGFTLPNSRIGVQFPVERLNHLDGTPRERWTPPVLVDRAHAEGDDPIPARGLAVLA